MIKKHKVTAIDFDADEVNDVVKPPVDSEEDDDATPISAHKGWFFFLIQRNERALNELLQIKS